MSPVDSGLYAFHKANIHERRFVAKVCAALPLLLLAGYLATLAYGLLRSPKLLLVTCALMNATTWLWITSTAVLSIIGACTASKALQRFQQQRSHTPICGWGTAAVRKQNVDSMDTVDRVVHMIVLPNFKEDEGMLAETLQALSEADESESFCVVLAMEEREANSQKKGERLKQRFQHAFGGITVTVHPGDLHQDHLDDSQDKEVPGKASNLKWAVPHGFAEFEKTGLVRSRASVILTVSDADCIFHPGYFGAVSREFNMLRENPGNDHLWTMYQAPQLPYRNYYDSAACCRIWAYISSAYEFGGVCSLDYGGTHMTFSGYSLPLPLALDAGAWDGDVIAEDHHAFLKCFFYSALASVEAPNSQAACVPQLKVQPVYLPVKSTSVASDSYWRTCVDRWWQAKRHAQGASEFSYAVLAVFDALLTLPWKSHSVAFYGQVASIFARLFCMHLLPICQGIGFMAMSAVWVYHGGHHPLCHTKASFMDVMMGEHSAGHYLVCGLAGAWVLVWPMVILTTLVILANFSFLRVAFFREQDAGRADTVWQREDGGVPHGGLSQSSTALLQTTLDCTLLLSLLMIPYGFFSNVAAYIEMAIYGNRVRYVTASKPAATATYGTLSACSTPPRKSSFDSSSTCERSWSEAGTNESSMPSRERSCSDSSVDAGAKSYYIGSPSDEVAVSVN